MVGGQSVLKMTSIKEHLEFKERRGDSFVNVSLGDPQPSRPGRVKSAGRWKVVVGVCVVAVVASAATLAIFTTDWPDVPGGAPGGVPGGVPAQEDEGPLTYLGRSQLGAPAAGEVINPLRQVWEPLEKTEALYIGSHRSHGFSLQDTSLQHSPNPNFQEETVLLEKVEEHDRPKRTHVKDKHQGFVEETVEVEVPNEHDGSKHPKLVVKPPVPNKKILDTSSSEKKVKDKMESTRLPTTRLASGQRVCETPECSTAATRILESLDLSVNPCDNFYEFACGGWINKHPIPESGETGTFDEAGDKLDKRLHLILETPAVPSDPEPIHMIHTFYDSCLDTDTLDSLGLAPLDPLLAGQGGWPMVEDSWDPSTFTLSTALNNLRDLSVFPLVAVGVDLDVEDVQTKIIYIDAGTVPLGVSIMDDPIEAVVGPYSTLMTDAAKLYRDYKSSSVTDEDIQKQVQDVIDFEIAFSKIVIKAVNETTDNNWRTNVTGVQTDTDAGTPGQFEWLAFLKEMFTDTGITITSEEPVISFKGPFFTDLSNLLAATDTKTLANAVGWWWLYELQLETTYAMRNISLQFSHALSGQQELPPRWQHCMDQVNYNLGFALSREYVDQFMADTVKPEATELVEDIRSAYASLLDENTWMLPEDLVVAKEKLEAIDPFVSYPDWIMDDAQLTLAYEDLEIVNEKHVENLINIGAWYDLHSLASLREEPEHSFLFPPTVVNAFYNPQENTITILAGILQSPFYSHNSLSALNYGGIGMVIGHEMTHGFDNTGRQFDKYGNLRQWWSNTTIQAYNTRAQCFIDQYDAYVPPELSTVGLNISINGHQTEGENIADNGGIREAFRAYQLYVERYGEEPRLPGLDEFDPNHLFYLGFANVWCEHKTAEVVLMQLYGDAHSPGRFRVLGPLSNDEQFSQVWGCPAGSAMNRGDNRCLLW
ncbi:neprilysin-1-like isoform X3 [Cherax quadricarinatus]